MGYVDKTLLLDFKYWRKMGYSEEFCTTQAFGDDLVKLDEACM